MRGREVVVLGLLAVTIIVVDALFVIGPPIIPLYCPANPDYCASVSP